MLTRAGRGDTPSVSGGHVPPLLFLTGLISVVCAHNFHLEAWFIHYWVFFAVALVTGEQVDMAVAALLALGVLVAAHADVPAVHRVAGARVLQYLGSRSYSIYLVHQTVLTTVLRIGVKVTGQDQAAAMAWIVVAAAASFVGAELFFRAVEKPSLRLSAYFKDRNEARTDAHRLGPGLMLGESGVG